MDDVRGADNFSVTETDGSGSKFQTAVFKEAPSLYSLDISAERDPTYNDGFSDNVDLGDFLSRPVKIDEYTWTAGYTTSNTNRVIDPWFLWQNDARVKMKLSNYAYMSCDLRLRIVINGSPFQYGRMMMIYIPYGDALGGTIADKRNQIAAEVQRWYSTAASGRIETAFQHFSTYPCVYLDPSTNQVKEMTLPFVWHNNYIAINGDSSVAKESLGTIQFYDINPLRIANTSAPTSVNITIYAWAENVKLTMPTEFVPSSSRSKWSYSSLDSRARSDEYDDGPISSISSSVAKAAGHLEKVPVIGPFAKATQIGAGALTNAARLFGFSAPAMVENPSRCELKMHGRLANGHGEDSSYSLAMDPKQEITVDPRTVGVAARDEMTIKSICTREQFLARCEWYKDVGQFTTPGAERLIFASLVSPNHIHRTGTGTVGGGNNQGVMDCPGGNIANLFQYWKGSITYRVEVVSTKLHSGRLKLQFDPFVKNGAYAVTDVNTEDVNARYTMILDLKEASETEFTIDWNSRRPWLRTQSDTGYSTFQPYRTDLVAFDLQTRFDEEVHMGMFTVSIVNELVAPIETDGAASATKAPVQVNIFVKMGEDIMFAQPSDDGSDWTKYKFTPASTKTPFSEGEGGEMTTVEEHSILDNPVDQNNMDVFFGEAIVSIRPLLKRYSNVFSGEYSNTDNTGKTMLVTRYLPYIPAYIHPLKARSNSFVSYLAPMFLIGRGSVRYKVTYFHRKNTAIANSSTSEYSWVERVGLRTPTNTLAGTIDIGAATSDTISNTLLRGYNGACFTESSYQPTLEFQLPFYSNTRYYLMAHYQNVSPAGSEAMSLNPSMTQIIAAKHQYSGVDANRQVMQQWHAAGDDFSLHFFTGVPMIFFSAS